MSARGGRVAGYQQAIRLPNAWLPDEDRAVDVPGRPSGPLGTTAQPRLGTRPRDRAIAEPLRDAGGTRTPHGPDPLVPARHGGFRGGALPGVDARRGFELGAQRPGRRWPRRTAPWSSRGRAPGRGRSRRSGADRAPVPVARARASGLHYRSIAMPPSRSSRRSRRIFLSFCVSTDQSGQADGGRDRSIRAATALARRAGHLATWPCCSISGASPGPGAPRSSAPPAGVSTPRPCSPSSIRPGCMRSAR